MILANCEVTHFQNSMAPAKVLFLISISIYIFTTPRK